MEAIIAKQFPKKVIPLIQEAKEHIEIIVFDWRFYPYENGSSVGDFNSAIFDAVKRGVKIKAIVNNDNVLAQLKKNGVEAKRVYSPKLIHAKLMLIDDKFCIIGSHNYTQSAFTMNYEVSAIIELDGPENDFSKYFKNLWPL